MATVTVTENETVTVIATGTGIEIEIDTKTEAVGRAGMFVVHALFSFLQHPLRANCAPRAHR